MIFRFLLWCVGGQLAIMSRFSSRVRGAITRDMCVTVQTKDGVARSYVFLDRRVSSHAGASPQASVTLTFNSAAQGTRIFLASNAIEQIVDGLGRRVIELQGDPTGIVWFYELVFGVLPWRKAPPYTMPDQYIAPDLNGKVSDQITREPAVDELDAAWIGAVRRRENLLMWRVGQGAPVPNKPINFQHVVDVPLDAQEKRS